VKTIIKRSMRGESASSKRGESASNKGNNTRERQMAKVVIGYLLHHLYKQSM